MRDIHAIFDYDPCSGRTKRLTKTAHRQKIGEEIGWINSTTGYRYATIRGKTKPLTHWIWFHQTGKFPTKHIDHIDGNILNNSWDNLRQVSRNENMSNKHGPQSNNSLGVLGVDKLGNKYRARLRRPGVSTTHLGMFTTPEEAYQVYLTERSKFAPVEGL